MRKKKWFMAFVVAAVIIANTMSVSATYTYINTSTLATGSSSDSSSGTTNTKVSFSAPTNGRTVKVSASHKVYLGSESWTGSTSATY